MDPATTIVVVGALIWSAIALGACGLKFAVAQLGKPRVAVPYRSRTERMLGI